jgi:thioredoxin reductase/bacterioferritin-associated ferredoxin
MMQTDLIVVGAGPAGIAAALVASEAGLDVVLLDEAAAAGGQIYRVPAARDRSTTEALAKSADQRRGDEFREALAASRVHFRAGRRVWSVGGRFRIDAVGPNGSEGFAAPRLIAATGANERIVPFEGWTLPGVIGLAAATILLKSQRMLPGRRVVVAGCGPLIAAVAAKIVEGGGEVAAIVDLASRSEWLATLPSLATRPKMLAEGLGWMVKLGLKRLPVFFRHSVRRAEGEDALQRVTIGPVDMTGRPIGGAEHRFDADCLAIGHGLVPGAEITRLLEATQRFDRLRGGFVPQLDDDGRTSVSGLYAAGDCAGIAGAIPAPMSGRLAGLAAASDAGAAQAQAPRQRAELLNDRAMAMRFADAMAGLMRFRPGMLDGIAGKTVVCRCEDVTRDEIETAIASGASEMNQLKHFTRCGMGPCQGRMCGEIAAELVAAHVGSREAAGQWTARPPLRPVPLMSVLGEFRYEDIPIPEPAPL